MHKFLHFKKLNQRGFDHVVLGVAFAVIIALGGTAALIAARADSLGGLKLDMTNANLCMENMNNSSVAYTTVEASTCSSSAESQHWTLKQQGSYFQIVAAASGACVDDYKQGVSPKGATSDNGLVDGPTAVVAETWPCTSGATDPGQLWTWNGKQLENDGSKACINDPQSSTVSGTRLIIFSCSGGSGSNSQWDQTTNSYSSGPATPAPTVPTACSHLTTGETPCTTGQISDANGNNTCVTAGSTVTMETCSNSSTAQQWTQLPSSTDTVVLYNETDSVYLGVSGSKVADTTAEAYWTAATDGTGYSLDQLAGGDSQLCVDYGSDTVGSAVTLQTCSAGTSQALTLLAAPACTGSSCESGGNGNPQTPNPITGPVPYTPTSPSPNQGDDIEYLLSILEQNGQTVNCSALSPADQSACNAIFKSGN